MGTRSAYEVTSGTVLHWSIAATPKCRNVNTDWYTAVRLHMTHLFDRNK